MADPNSDHCESAKVTLAMDAREARAVHLAISTTVELMRQLGEDVPPHAPLYGERDRLITVARRLDHAINHSGDWTD